MRLPESAKLDVHRNPIARSMRRARPNSAAPSTLGPCFSSAARRCCGDGSPAAQADAQQCPGPELEAPFLSDQALAGRGENRARVATCGVRSRPGPRADFVSARSALDDPLSLLTRRSGLCAQRCAPARRTQPQDGVFRGLRPLPAPPGCCALRKLGAAFLRCARAGLRRGKSLTSQRQRCEAETALSARRPRPLRPSTPA